MSRRGTFLGTGAVVLGFLLGGLAGWSQRPAEWRAGLLETAEASVNAATYGHAYEAQAERVLLFFIWGGCAGAVSAALIVGVSRRIRRG